jgi:hypothetical protein
MDERYVPPKPLPGNPGYEQYPYPGVSIADGIPLSKPELADIRKKLTDYIGGMQ